MQRAHRADAGVLARLLVATERAGVHRWRARYAAEDIVDGVGWSVRIAAGGRVVASSGTNAYPDRFGREHDSHDRRLSGLPHCRG